MIYLIMCVLISIIILFWILIIGYGIRIWRKHVIWKNMYPSMTWYDKQTNEIVYILKKYKDPLTGMKKVDIELEGDDYEPGDTMWETTMTFDYFYNNYKRF